MDPETNVLSEQKRKPETDSPAKPPRKRKRIVISCTECHRRKQKCDRAAPCSNCVARNKHSLCQYENESARKQQLLEESTNGTSSDDGGVYGPKAQQSDTAVQVSAFGYAQSNRNNNTTLGLFKKIEGQDSGASSIIARPTSSPSDHGLREKYKSFIRQLPSKPYIERLITTFFREFNYQYYPLDEAIFRDHLKNWHNLSFQTLNKGPLELPGDLQFFPALLFQILALGLQFQPPGYDPDLESLKYAASMSFDDLASDYSESGTAILSLLGKRHITLVAVQAGFLRAAYLKNCGMVAESWHSLSQTIRDAQEVGLHKGISVQQQRNKDEKPEDILERLWLEQLGRRMWLILSLWDIHMAIVLGRPTTIDCRDGKPAFPIDAPTPKNRREVAPSARLDSEPPTPLTCLLWTAEIAAPLWDIFNLEKEDPHQNNFSKVEKMHKMIKQISLHCPPFFRAQYPDTTFDGHPDCYWLPRSRPLFQSGSAFTIMALHRPYIFTSASSRTSALKAGLDILRAQRTFFNLISTLHYKSFALVLNTFDATVLVGGIYILHPHENGEDLDDTLQHFEWAMERFQTMGSRNAMAQTGLGVLKAIYVRLRKALKPKNPEPITSVKIEKDQISPANTCSAADSPTGALCSAKYSHPSISSASTISSSNQSASTANTQYTLPTISNMTEATPASTSAWDAFSGSISMVPQPQNFDLSSMAPLQPMHDLLYNDLSGTVDGALDFNVGQLGGWSGDAGGNNDLGAQWQFEGDFGSDSFWGFMNNYDP